MTMPEMELKELREVLGTRDDIVRWLVENNFATEIDDGGWVQHVRECPACHALASLVRAISREKQAALRVQMELAGNRRVIAGLRLAFDQMNHDGTYWVEEVHEKLAILDRAYLAEQRVKVLEDRVKWLAEQAKAAQEKADKAAEKFNEMLKAEHAVSNAYIRLRLILGTMRTDYPAIDESVWKATEAAAVALAERATAAEERARLATQEVERLRAAIDARDIVLLEREIETGGQSDGEG